MIFMFNVTINMFN